MHAGYVISIVRLLPHSLGWPNPPGSLSYIPTEPDEQYTWILLSWQPPTYTGGLNETSFDYSLFVDQVGANGIEAYFIGSVTVLPLAMVPGTYHLSIAITSSSDLVQDVISERSQQLTVSGYFCITYCKSIEMESQIYPLKL